MRAANEQFLAADKAIAEIAQRKRMMAGLKSQAVVLAQVYRAIDLDVATAEGAAQSCTSATTQLQAQWDADGPQRLRHRAVRHRRRHRRRHHQGAEPLGEREHARRAARRLGPHPPRPGQGRLPEGRRPLQRGQARARPGHGAPRRARRAAQQRTAGGPRSQGQRRRAAARPPRRVRPAGRADQGRVGGVAARRLHGPGHGTVREPARRPGHLAVRHALPPDPALHEAAHRHRLRRAARRSMRSTTAACS